MKIPHSDLTIQQSTLLLFIAGGEGELDPIRIMKGLFVFSMEVPPEWRPPGERYKFIPYSYGPYSNQITTDLGLLTLKGYIHSRAVPGRSWLYYSPSNEGKLAAANLESAFGKEAVDYLRRLREWVTGMSFRMLLNAVYKKYPAYAVNSVFKY